MRRSALLLLALVVGACATAAPAPAPERREVAEHDFSVRVPAGWHVAGESLTPKLTDPVEILAAGTLADLRPVEGECAHVPVGALEALGPRDAFVTVQERLGAGRFPPRPQSFALVGRVRHGSAQTCAQGERRLAEYWVEFADAGRRFHVLIAFGPQAPPERRREALALLDSLRFEPATAPRGRPAPDYGRAR